MSPSSDWQDLVRSLGADYSEPLAPADFEDERPTLPTLSFLKHGDRPGNGVAYSTPLPDPLTRTGARYPAGLSPTVAPPYIIPCMALVKK